MSISTRFYYAARGDLELRGLNQEIGTTPIAIDAFLDFQASLRNDGVALTLFTNPVRPLFLEVAAPEDGAWFLKNAFVDEATLVFSAPVDKTRIVTGTFKWTWDGGSEDIALVDLTFDEQDRQVTVPAPTLPADYVGSLALTFADMGGALGGDLQEAITLHYDITADGSLKPQTGGMPVTRPTITGFLEVGRLVASKGQDVNSMIYTFVRLKQLARERILKIVQVEGPNGSVEIFLLWWKKTCPRVLSVAPKSSGTLAFESPPAAIILQFDQAIQDPSDYGTFDGVALTDVAFTVTKLDSAGKQWLISKSGGLFATVGQHTLKVSGVPNEFGDMAAPPVLFSWQVQPLAASGTSNEGASVSGSWKFDTSIVAADPGNKKFRANNATLASVTQLYFNDTTVLGFDASTVLGFLNAGDRIYVQQKNDATRAALFIVTAPATDNTGWWTVPVMVLESGTLYQNAAECAVVIAFGTLGVTDHGALGGLTDDDHPQYLTGAPATSVRNKIIPGGTGIIGLPFKILSGQTADIIQALGRILVDEDQPFFRVTPGGSIVLGGPPYYPGGHNLVTYDTTGSYGVLEGWGANLPRITARSTNVILSLAGGAWNYDDFFNAPTQYDADFTMAQWRGMGVLKFKVTMGNGSPETVVTAPPGSTYWQRDAASYNSLWVKGSGTGNTGWLNVANEVKSYADGILAAHVAASDPHTGYILATGSRAFTGDQSMGSHYLTNLLNPVNAQDAATKAYVDAVVLGLSPKTAVKCATTGPITLSGEQTIDGFSTSASRVLVKDQTLPEENGIYVSAAGAWTRATDADSWAELVSAFVFVEQGTLNGDNGWLCTSNAGGTLGVTAVNWVQFSGAGQIVDGAALLKTGNQLDVQVDNSSIEIASDALRVKAGGITESHLGLSNVTTNDVSATQHGFAPRAPGNANLFLNGLAGAFTAVPGRLIAFTVFTTPGLTMWTPDSRTTMYDVFAKGGGGGSGSTGACPGGTAAAASGGASGSYCFKHYPSAPAGPVGLTVGAFGIAGAGGGGGGGGGATTFPDVAANLNAPGGGGGLGAAAGGAGVITVPGTPGGVATGGDINCDGDVGGIGLVLAVAAVGIWGGDGAGGPWGSKQQGTQNGLPGATLGYGSGAAAPSTLGAFAVRAGRPGTAGIVIVWEYT